MTDTTLETIAAESPELLTAAEIEAVQRDGVDPASPGLVGFWSLDEGQGQDVHDLSPALNDGYLGANPDADSADPAWTPA